HVRGAHRDPGRADPALRTAARDQLALHRMQHTAARQALDRDDPAPVALTGRDQAGVHRLAVELDGAGAALALAAALLGAGQSQILAQHVEQALPRRDLNRARLAVDLECELHDVPQRGRARAITSGEIGSSSNATPSASSMAL